VITQLWLDGFSSLCAGFLAHLPTLPDAFNTAIGQINAGEAWLSARLGMFGVVVPWSVATTCLVLWGNLLLFWVVCVGLRLIAWLMNR
jgi:hypothetical protein